MRTEPVNYNFSRATNAYTYPVRAGSLNPSTGEGQFKSVASIRLGVSTLPGRLVTDDESQPKSARDGKTANFPLRTLNASDPANSISRIGHTGNNCQNAPVVSTESHPIPTNDTKTAFFCFFPLLGAFAAWWLRLGPKSLTLVALRTHLGWIWLQKVEQGCKRLDFFCEKNI